MIKIMTAAAGLALGLLMMPVATTPTQAGIDIDINLDGRISCRQGKRIVENRGFHRVQPRDCEGREYAYFGRKHGDSFIITLSSRRGRIIDIREIGGGGGGGGDDDEDGGDED